MVHEDGHCKASLRNEVSYLGLMPANICLVVED